MAHLHKNFVEWDSVEIASWLCSINMSYLIPTFERNDITGDVLPSINDSFMKETLRMNKPGEMAALRGALAVLTQQESRKQTKTLPQKSQITLPRGVRERTASNGADAKPALPKTATLPGKKIDTGAKEPQLLIAPARQLLDDHCKHSGWIRKQGGGRRTWKKRYLILRLGCLYYYVNETATTPKGQFTLPGYKTKLCDETAITDRYPWTLEIIPSNPAMRVYYVAAGAKKELENWKAAIDSEIEFYKKSIPSGGSFIPAASSHQHGEASNDRLSPPAVIDGASSEEEDNQQAPIYDEPPDSDDNDEGGKGIYVDLINKNGSDEGEVVGGMFRGNEPALSRSQTTSDGKPRIPERPPQYISASLPMSSAMWNTGDDDEDKPGSLYLDLNEVNNVAIATSPSTSTKMDHKKISVPTAPPTTPRVPLLPEAKLPVPDYEVDSNFDDPSGEPEDSENPYYILFSSPEEIMPECCMFQQLERDEVDRLLRSKNHNGTYLIREGNHAGTEKVLSVWHIDKCRHYKLFKDERGLYSLTQGTPFKTIPALLQHYQKQSHLPKSDFYLTVPYKPDDQ